MTTPKKNLGSSQPSRKAATKSKTSTEAFESQLTSSASTARESETSRLSMPFLSSIKEVVAKRSQYSDGCYADIKFKDGKHKACSLDYDCPAEPGDKLRLSSLRWKTFTSDDGETFTVLYGEVI